MMENKSAERLFREYESLDRSGNQKAALQKLRRAANTGAVYAVYTLAYEYYNATPPRIREALNLYKNAASKGDYAAAWNLARHFELVPNARWYRFWLQRSQQLGMEWAGNELKEPFPYLLKRARSALRKGDISTATNLLTYAAKNGSTDAAKMLGKRPLKEKLERVKGIEPSS